MYGFLYRLGSWLLQKAGVAVLIVVISLVGLGIWLYARDQVDSETRRQQYVTQLESSRARLVAAQAEALAAVEALRGSLQQQQERIVAAERVVAKLQALADWWERWFGNAAQQQANADQIERMQTLQHEAGNRIVVLTRELNEAVLAAQDVEFQLGSLERDLAAARQSESAAAHYLREAWHHSRGYLLAALLAYFFGPTVIKTLAYFGLAPWLSRGRAIQFSSEQAAVPHVRPSAVSVEVGLWPGEVLRVKEAYLQASDNRLRRKTRFVFDWTIPFTSLACGLTELVELRNGQAGERARLTLSNSDDPHTELAVIEVPEGASLILRPSFLIGVITANEDKVTIRRRWALLRWQAWITLQFRFFEFVGPCRLVVAGSRGVRAEVLSPGDGGLRPARRTNQLATIGFTPSLDYLPVRAETFWGYYRGMNPLFDDLFAGTGLFVVQETANETTGGRPARFWQSVWSSLLKVFGL